MRLIEFVSQLKIHLSRRIQGSSQLYPLQLVLGNSSADYDSIFGSLLLAYYLTLTFESIHFPVIDCAAKSIKNRFEVMYVMNSLNINPTDLIYRQDISQSFWNQANFTLYDHNQRKLPSKPIGIVDHHFYTTINCEHYLITHMGSALSLVFLLMEPNLIPESLASEFTRYTINKPIKTLAIEQPVLRIIRNGILLDCYNFSPKEASRWTQVDLMIYKLIEERIHFPYGYKQLQQVKFSLQMNSKLSLQQQLQKDFKMIQFNVEKPFIIHWSVISMSVTAFMKLYGKKIMLKQSFENYLLTEQTTCTAMPATIYFISFVFPQEGIYKRQMLVSGPKQIVKQTIQPVFVKAKLVQSKHIGPWKHYIDPSATISRKMLDKILKTQLNHSSLNI